MLGRSATSTDKASHFMRIELMLCVPQTSRQLHVTSSNTAKIMEIPSRGKWHC